MRKTSSHQASSKSNNHSPKESGYKSGCNLNITSECRNMLDSFMNDITYKISARKSVNASFLFYSAATEYNSLYRENPTRDNEQYKKDFIKKAIRIIKPSIKRFYFKEISNILNAYVLFESNPETDIMDLIKSRIGQIASYDTSDNQYIVRSLTAFTKLGFFPAELEHPFKDIIQPRIASFNAQAIANSLWAFATLNIELDETTINTFKSAIFDQITNFNSQNIANSLWAFATLNMELDPEIIGEFKSAIKDNITNFNPQAIANSLWAFAKLNIELDETTINIFKSAIKDNITSFNSQDITNSLWAFAKLNIRLDETTINTFKSAINNKITSFNSQAISNSLWAFATLNIGLDETTINTFKSAINNKITSFNSQEIANSLWAFATLNIRLDETTINTFKSAIKDNITSFNSQEISNSLWAFAKLNIGLDETTINTFKSAIKDNITSFNPQDISNSLWAFATLNIGLDETTINKFKSAIKDKITNFDSQNIANSIWACAKLNIPLYKTTINKFKSAINNKITSFNSQEIANSLWACAVLDLMNLSRSSDSRLPDLHQYIKDNLTQVEFNTDEIRQIFTAEFIIAKLYPEYNLDSYSLLSQDNIDSLLGNSSISEPSQLAHNLFSRLKEALNSENFNIEEEVILQELMIPVDIFIPEKKLVIQIDEPCHYYSNGEINAATVLNTKLLELAGYNLYRIDYKSLNNNFNASMENMLGKISEIMPATDYSTIENIEIDSEYVEGAEETKENDIAFDDSPLELIGWEFDFG